METFLSKFNSSWPLNRGFFYVTIKGLAMPVHNEISCGNTFRIKRVEEDVVDLKKVLGEVVKTQSLIGRVEERSQNQSETLSRMVDSQKKTESRIGKLERSEDLRTGEKSGLIGLGRGLTGVAIVVATIIAFFAMASS